MNKNYKNIKEFLASDNRCKAVRRVLKNVATAVLLVLLLGQLTIMVLCAGGKEELIGKLPVSLLKVTSDSMYPVLRTGDWILSVDTPYEEIREGDIVTYFYNNTLVTHKVVSVNEDDTLTMKGLANSYTDGNIPKIYYVGKMFCRIPYLNDWVDMTQSMVGKILAIMLIIVLCYGRMIGLAIYNKVENYTKNAAGKQQ